MSRRIAVAIIGMVVGTLALSAFATLIVARVSERNAAERVMRTQAEGVAGLLPDLERTNPRRNQVDPTTDPTTDPTADPATTTTVARRPVIERIQKALSVSGVSEIRLDADGTISGTLPTPVRDQDVDRAQLQSGRSISGHRLGTLYAMSGRQLAGGSTLVAIITQPQGGFFGPTLRWFVVCSIIAVLIGSFVAVVLGRRLGEPVHAVVETTQRIASGDLDARLDASRTSGDDDDELAILARSVNSMADSLQRARSQERQFLMSVSHDLRTPLTSIRGYAESIADGASPDPAQAADVIIAESKRLERLVGDLLSLARLEVNAFPLSPQVIDLGTFLDAAAAGIGPELADGSTRIDVSGAPGVRIAVDPDRLNQVIGNLLTNAAGYARSTVWLRAGAEGADAMISVADDGPGIPPGDLPHVFERLYQADNQSVRRRPGSGVGLAIVAELTAAMGGRVDVRSEVGIGTTFTLRFPIAPR